MRAQMLLIAILVSLNLWVLSFDAVRAGYREAQVIGVMHNLHIGQRLDRLI